MTKYKYPRRQQAGAHCGTRRLQLCCICHNREYAAAGSGQEKKQANAPVHLLSARARHAGARAPAGPAVAR